MIEFKGLRVNDAAKLLSIREDKNIRDMYIGNIYPSSLDVETQWISSLRDKEPYLIVFGIFSDERLIGLIQIKNINHINRNCEVALFIEKKEQGKGYGNKSLDFIINYCFQTLNLNKCFLHVLASNIKAINLYQKKGFSKVGVLKNHIYINGGYQDLNLMELFNE